MTTTTNINTNQSNFVFVNIFSLRTRLFFILSALFFSSAFLITSTQAAWNATVSIPGNTVTTGVWESVILAPAEGESVSGSLDLIALYVDENGDGNDGVQWAVRAGTCAAGTGTRFGNVDGFNTPFTWNGQEFAATIDTTSVTDGAYCFVFNPIEDAGDANVRLTRNFTISNTIVPPAPPAPVLTNIVLNEIYPRPLATSTQPLEREWVELYNETAYPVDVLGWKVSEISGTSTENVYTIVASGATASQMQPFGTTDTVIAPGGLLILQFGGASSRLNDVGDTVRLYTSLDTLLDSHTYPSTAAGKSHQRIPDGGIWVDPEPTPGQVNRVSRQDLIDSGLSLEQIEEVVALLAARGEYLIGEEVLFGFAPTAAETLAALLEDSASSTEETAEEDNASTTPEEITDDTSNSGGGGGGGAAETEAIEEDTPGADASLIETQTDNYTEVSDEKILSDTEETTTAEIVAEEGVSDEDIIEEGDDVNVEVEEEENSVVEESSSEPLE